MQNNKYKFIIIAAAAIAAVVLAFFITRDRVGTLPESDISFSSSVSGSSSVSESSANSSSESKPESGLDIGGSSEESSVSEQSSSSSKPQSSSSSSKIQSSSSSSKPQNSSVSSSKPQSSSTAQPTLKFRNKNLLNQHYQKHGIDMGFSSAEEYEKAAARVPSNPNALHKIEKEDGDDIYYIESTNEFVVVSTDGYLRTYFNPDRGIDYFNRQ